MSVATNAFKDSEWQRNIVKHEPNDYLYAQRALKHKIEISYKQMENLFIAGSATGSYFDAAKFTNNEYEFTKLNYETDAAKKVQLELGEPNANNATNLIQLYSETTYNRNISYDKFLYLDGKTTFDSGVLDKESKKIGLRLLSRNYSGETVETIGWMSRSVCDENGYFANPVRLVHEFRSDQSISKWLIRSVATEVPVDFSVCIYDKEKKIIYKSKVFKNNSDNTIKLTVNRGLCRYIELRITRWGVKDAGVDGGVKFKPTGAKIVYFFHDATFPKGVTAYKSNDLLRSFSVNEYLCSSIGKANYGVQSNTGQFSLINISKLFDTLVSTGHLKNGLKVQYYVSVDKYYAPKVDKDGFVDESNDDISGNYEVAPPPHLNEGEEVFGEASEDTIIVDDNSMALSLAVDNNEWKLLATQYITDIEFDEVKGVVRFKTQDRMIKFKDSTYSGYKKVVNGRLAPIRNDDLIRDIMNRALQSTNDADDEADDILRYEITPAARQILQSRTIYQGYLDEMSIWAALQKACDLDLIHIYVNRDNVLMIDKIDQL